MPNAPAATPLRCWRDNLLRRFAFRRDCYLLGQGVRHEAVTERELDAHLRGEARVGLFPEEKTSFLCLDFDGKNLAGGREEAWCQATSVGQVARERFDVEVAIELTRSGAGYHVWIFFRFDDMPTLAEAKVFGRRLLGASGLPDDEKESEGHPGIYPHPPGSKGVGKTTYLPWCGIVNEPNVGIFVNEAGQPIRPQEAGIQTALASWKEVSARISMSSPSPDLAAVPPEATDLGAGSDGVGKSDVGSSRHDALRGHTLRLANELPRDRAEPIIRELAKGLGLGPDREREITGLVESAYSKPGTVADSWSWAPMQLDGLFEEAEVGIRYLITGWISASEVVLLAAPPGAGKTLVLIAIAGYAAAGKPVLGQFEVPKPLRVLYIDEECGELEMRRRLRKLLRGGGIDAQSLERNLRIFPQQGLRLSDDSVRRFHEEVRAYRPDLVVIDTLISVYTGDENSNADARAWYQKVIAPLRRDPGCAVILSHHTNKGADSDTPRLTDLRGASDFYGAPEKVWMLTQQHSSSTQVKVRLKTLKSRRNDAIDQVTVVFTDTQGGAAITVGEHPIDKDLQALVGAPKAARIYILDRLGRDGAVARDKLIEDGENLLGVGMRSIETALSELITGGQVRKESDSGDKRKVKYGLSARTEAGSGAVSETVAGSLASK